MYLGIVLKGSLVENLMTYLSPNNPPKPVHPLDILDQSYSGYIIDIIENFKGIIEWRLDCESLCALFLLVARHFPALKQDLSDAELPCSPEALILRLKVAGLIIEDRKGYFLSDTARERRAGVFSKMLADPSWRDALEQVKEDLMVFAETEGIPLAIA